MSFLAAQTGGMVQEVDSLTLFTPAEAASEAVRNDYAISAAGIVAAADRGDLRVAVRTPSGRRLIARADLLEFVKTRREARRLTRRRIIESDRQRVSASQIP
jgi:hypothetical protein